MNAHKWADLKELSDDELIAEHDAVAENTAVGTQHYLDELRYRQQACVAEATGQFRWHQRALCQGRSKFGPLRRSKSRPVGEGVAVFVGRLERSLWSPFRAAQA